MGTLVSGIDGDVSFDAAALDDVRNWSIEIEIDNDSHAHSDSSGWKVTTTGAKHWSGEFTVDADNGKVTSALWTAFNGGTAGTFSGTADTGVTYAGSIKLTGISGVGADINTGEALTHTWSFQGNGALTPTTT